MSTILGFFESEAMTGLVTVLLHSLWQGIAIAIVLGIALKLLAARRTAARYTMSLMALGLIVLGSFITWGILEIEPRESPVQEDGTALEAGGSAEAGQEASLRPVPPLDRQSPAEAAGPPDSFPWQRWAGVAWAAGTVLMLIRAARSVRGASRVRRRCRPVDDPKLIKLVEGLKDTLGVTRRFRLLLAERLDVPAVVGFIAPTLLLPAGIVTTLTPEQTRMVLAHELAHIRRHDYLVNIVQLILEAFFFFNPAVWWVSRQIRLEREACCDAEAVRITGEPTGYAETLAGIATSLKPAGRAPTAAAAAHHGDEGALLSRVHRLLQPGHAPGFRVPWPSATLIFLGSALALVALQQCTTTVVQATAEWLSPRERIEKIAGLEKTHTVPEGSDLDYEKLEKVQVRGTLKTTDGRPLPDGWKHINARTRRRSAAIGHHLNVEKDGFTGRVTPGTIRISIDAPGYAPVVLGPFEVEPGETLEDLEVELDPGFPVSLEVTDESGAGIPDVPVSTLFRREEMSARARDLVTDAAGKVLIENAAADLELQVSARLPEYQYDKRTYHPKEGMPLVLPLRRAEPATGTVRSKVSGEAVAGARVALASRAGFEDFTVDPREDWARKRYPEWTTDADGRFRLDTLRDDCTYIVYIEAPDHDPVLIDGVRPGMQDIEVSLEPPRVIECRIIGDLSRLHTYRGRTRLGYRNPVKIGDTHYSMGLEATVSVEAGEGRATIENLLADRVTLSAPGSSITIQAREPGIYRSVIDLDHPEKSRETGAVKKERTVVVEVVPPEGSPTPEGKLRVDYVPPGSRGYRPFWLPLEEGRVEIEVELPPDKPGKVRYGPLYASGYWIADRSEIPVPPGDEALGLTVQAHPAGAIYGRVLDAEGRPHDRYNLTVVTVERPGTPGSNWPSNHEAGSGDHEDGRFLLGALPLGGIYCVAASDSTPGSCARVLSEPIRIDPEKPIREIELEIPRGVDVPVRITSEDGDPLPGVRISLDYSTPYSHGFGGAEQSTDREGRYVFQGVNPDLPGSHRLDVRPHGPYCGSLVELTVDGTLNRIVLARGVSLRGRVVNDTRGEPLARAKIQLWPIHGQQVYMGRVEGQTDDKGRFVIQGLEPAGYRIHIPDTRALGTTVRVDEEGRRWFSEPDSGSQYVDLSGIDLDEEYEIRVMTEDDPRLHPER